MLPFKPITAESLTEISPLLKDLPFRTCEYTPGVIYMWRHFFDNEYAVKDHMLFMRSVYAGQRTYYSLPVGTGNSLAAMDELAPFAENGVLLLGAVPEEALPQLQDHYADRLCASEETDWYDYLYAASDLSSLTGRKYRGQRNHINFFTGANPEWQYRTLTEETLPLAADFFRAFPVKQSGEESEEDHRATADVLQNFRRLPLTGGLITTKEGPVAFAAGEVVGDTLFVHIEKALRECRGAYQMIVREFSADICRRFPQVRYINREDDTGDEGLRISKQSYHPYALLKKYAVTIRIS